MRPALAHSPVLRRDRSRAGAPAGPIRRCAVAAALLLAVGLAPAGAAERTHEPWTDAGRAGRVTDGDTLHVDTADHGPVIVRIAGIDAPERGQAHWRVARAWLREAVQDRPVTLTCHKTDRYGREVCRVDADGRDLGAGLVAAGLAWHAEAYAHEQTPEDRRRYAALQQEARDRRSGLWSDADPQPPADCRRERRTHGHCR